MMLQTKIKSSVGTANTQCKSLKSVAKVTTSDLHNFEPMASETGRKAFLSCFTVSEKEFYIFQQCTYIVFSLQCQKAQTTDKMSKNSRNKHCSNGFLCDVCIVPYHHLAWIKYQKIYILVKHLSSQCNLTIVTTRPFSLPCK